MQYLVWVDSWQQQCCGTPFSVGDTVDWTLSAEPDRAWLATTVGSALADAVTHAEHHHTELPESWPRTTARVGRIRAAFCRYVPAPSGVRALLPVPDSVRLTDVRRGDGWDAESDGLRFNGYLVTLDDDVSRG